MGNKDDDDDDDDRNACHSRQLMKRIMELYNFILNWFYGQMLGILTENFFAEPWISISSLVVMFLCHLSQGKSLLCQDRALLFK